MGRNSQGVWELTNPEHLTAEQILQVTCMLKKRCPFLIIISVPKISFPIWLHLILTVIKKNLYYDDVYLGFTAGLDPDPIIEERPDPTYERKINCICPEFTFY